MKIKTRLGLYLICDPLGIIDDYILYLLNDIKEELTDLVIICNGYLSGEGRKRLEQFTSEIFVRPNEGFDAEGWKQAMVEYYGFDKVSSYDEIILFNDSFFGPLFPFKEVFKEMDSKDVDFWGLSVHGKAKSAKNMCPYGDRPRYLQTYFLAIRKNMVSSEAFQKYWIDLPLFEDFTSLVEKHGCVFTKYFEELGFKWMAYSDTTDLETEEIRKNCSYHTFNLYDMIINRKFPIVKRKAFTLPKKTHLRYNNGGDLKRSIDYIQKNTNYDVGLIYRYLLRRYNISDLKESLNLNYILPEKYEAKNKTSDKRIAVIAHLFYSEMFEYCSNFIFNCPENFDVYITTDTEEKKKEIEKIFYPRIKNRLTIIVVKSRGRDLSALLVGCKNIPEKYDYICFIHDKKSIQKELVTVGLAFRDLLWENMLYNKNYISHIINLFEENHQIGLLVPPNVSHGSYFSSSVNYWTICYDKARETLGRIGVDVDLDPNKPPIAVGTVFWARSEALLPLLKENWSYEDFPAEPLPLDGSISHALERLFPYIAQSQGYITGTVMSSEFAESDIANYRYMMNTTLKLIKGLPSINFSNFENFTVSLIRFRNMISKGRFDIGLKQALKNFIKKHIPDFILDKLIRIKNKIIN